MTRVICLFALLTTLGANLSSVSAAEPGCALFEVGVPMLSKLPYLNRLFKNVRVDGDCEECVEEVSAVEELPCPAGTTGCAMSGGPHVFRHVRADGLERIGVDFDFEFDGPCAAGKCAAVQYAAEACAKGQCAAGQCATGECAEACAAGRCAPAFAVFASPLAGPSPLLMQLDSLSVQNWQLLEALIASRVENATLAAQVEFADERQTLVVENALLKAKVAPATNNTELAQLREENTALKAKLIAMEERLASLEKPVKKTADKATAKRKR